MAHRTVNLLSQGFLDVASEASRKAVDEARNASQPTVLCVSLAWAAGFIALSLGELQVANDYGEELVGLAYKHGLRPFHAAGLCVRGSLAVRRGDPEVGVDLLRSGLADMHKAMYLLFHPFFRVELAKALGAVGSFAEAIDEIDGTLRFAEETDYRWFVPDEILRTRAELMTLRGSDDPASIEGPFRRSMQQAIAQQAVYWELSAATDLTGLLLSQGRERRSACDPGTSLWSFYGGVFGTQTETGEDSLGSIDLIR